MEIPSSTVTEELMGRSLKLLSAAAVLAWSAQASLITLGGPLSAANENPPNASTATGSAFVMVDTVGLTIALNVAFSGLTTNDTAAHIHCCVPLGGNTGVATAVPALPGFPLGVTSGTFSGVTFSLLDPAFYNPAFITANGGSVSTAEPVFLSGLLNNQTYFNIHTINNPGGEVRAFLVPVPEPATVFLTGLALLGIAGTRRWRK
jgi:CHRD domain/PEP-CTERM motif